MTKSKKSKQKLHMIGNAHLDPVWLWQWQEGFQEAKATFRSALDRLKEYEDFIFTSSSAAIYEWVENNDPEMFEEIRQRVAEGRWQIMGGWWIQPDCNLPSGESFARQSLYGQRYFQSRFGVTAKVGYNVDSFGHHGMLPQILKKSGMDYYVFMRPMPSEKGLPGDVFLWESDDGSQVMTFRIMYEYVSWGKDLEPHVKRCSESLRDPVDELMVFYGVGNHGGGPTKQNIESIRRLDKDPNFPEVVFSTPNMYFDAMSKKNLPLPIVHDDLQHHASGCYAVHSGIKHWNRKSENRLVTAEKFSSIAANVTGQPYPKNFDQAWKNVLFNQFHDILAGTSISPAYDDAMYLFGESMAIADRNLNYAVQSMSWKINIEQNEDMRPIVVFNPHPWPVRQNVEHQVYRMPEVMYLTDETGQQVPCQSVKSQATTNGVGRISFIAELPPMGYRVYKLFQTPPESKQQEATIKATDYSMENEWLRLEFDPKTGHIVSLHDKQHDIEVMGGPGARGVIVQDDSDTWSHEVLHFNKRIGEFMGVEVKRIEHGPVRSTIRVIGTYNQSKLIQEFTMYKTVRKIDVKVTVDWREQHKMLKLAFPVKFGFTRQTYEIPFGFKEREFNGEEEPGLSWVDITGIALPKHDVYGLSLINDAKYSYSIDNRELALTVLRSPIYAHHDPLVPDPGEQYEYIDQGIQTFHYTLLPHAGHWETAGTVRRAAELLSPPISVIETFHEGPLPQQASFLSVDVDNVMISAVKKAEDNDDIIVRCYETNRTDTKACLRLPYWKREIELEFGPCEIKTLRVPTDPNAPVVETNLLENDNM